MIVSVSETEKEVEEEFCETEETCEEERVKRVHQKRERGNTELYRNMYQCRQLGGIGKVKGALGK